MTRQVSVTEAERILGEAKWQEAANKREAKNKARREARQAIDHDKRQAERIAAVLARVEPFVRSEVVVKFEPESEGTLTLSLKGHEDLIITASGDDMTFLDISGT